MFLKYHRALWLNEKSNSKIILQPMILLRKRDAALFDSISVTDNISYRPREIYGQHNTSTPTQTSHAENVFTPSFWLV